MTKSSNLLRLRVSSKYYTCLFFLGSLECIRNDLGQTEIQWVEFSRHLLKHIGFSESYLSNFFINWNFHAISNDEIDYKCFKTGREAWEILYGKNMWVEKSDAKFLIGSLKSKLKFVELFRHLKDSGKVEKTYHNSEK